MYDLDKKNYKNYNTNNLKKDYFKSELNLDHLKDLYIKKGDDSKHPKTTLKSKMDNFYKELNDFKISNKNQKSSLKNYFNDKYVNINKYITKSNYLSNSKNNEFKYNQDDNRSEKFYKDIKSLKQSLKELPKEDFINLPFNIKSELKDIFNILCQIFN